MTLRSLHQQGVIKMLHTRGLISAEIMLYFDYYDDYLLLRTKGKSYRDSILDTSLKHNVSYSTIERAISKLKE